MYQVIKPAQRSTHNLNINLSQRVESKVESFHGTLAHFANLNMNPLLADILNLQGTARYNVQQRHKLLISQDDPPPVEANCVPQYFYTLPLFYNHTHLWFINDLAEQAGFKDWIPFQNVESLPEDNGERFFSEYLDVLEKNKQYPAHPQNDRCQCPVCAENPIPLQHDPLIPEHSGTNSIATSSRACATTAPPRIDSVGKAVMPFVEKHLNKRQEQQHCSPLLPPQTIMPQQTQQYIYCGPPSFPHPHLQQARSAYYYPRIHPGCYPVPTFTTGMKQIPGHTMITSTTTSLGGQQERPTKNRKQRQKQFCCVNMLVYESKKGRKGRPPRHSENCHTRQQPLFGSIGYL